MTSLTIVSSTSSEPAYTPLARGKRVITSVNPGLVRRTDSDRNHVSCVFTQTPTRSYGSDDPGLAGQDRKRVAGRHHRRTDRRVRRVGRLGCRQGHPMAVEHQMVLAVVLAVFV